MEAFVVFNTNTMEHKQVITLNIVYKLQFSVGDFVDN